MSIARKNLLRWREKNERTRAQERARYEKQHYDKPMTAGDDIQ